MATARAHIRIARPAAEVWQAVSDPTAIKHWFPGVAECVAAGDVRHVSTTTGVEVDERIVANDATLRRFQYALLPGAVPVESHLATVDVIEDGEGALVVYGVDVLPDALGSAMQSTVEGAVAGLREHLEGAA